MPLTRSGIAYDRAGPLGEVPVVLVHAGVADRRMWDPVWSGLTAGRDCVRVDLRGFGESTSRPEGALDPVGDLMAVLDVLGIGRCHLVGASYGAGVCVETALTHPGRVASLLLCPPGGSLLAERTPDFRAFAAAEGEALEAGDLDAAVQANIDTWLVGPGRTPDQVDPPLIPLVGMMQRRAFELTADWDDLEEAELDPPALDRIGELTCPVHVLLGGHDLLITQDAARRVVEGAPDVRRTDWTDVAHLPSLERPQDFVALTLAWTAEPATT